MEDVPSLLGGKVRVQEYFGSPSVAPLKHIVQTEARFSLNLGVNILTNNEFGRTPSDWYDEELNGDLI